eukprot:9504186-Pyramimonas_sp.AAC.1
MTSRTIAALAADMFVLGGGVWPPAYVLRFVFLFVFMFSLGCAGRAPQGRGTQFGSKKKTCISL